MSDIDIKEKICRKCRQIKPAQAFYENKYSPDGLYAFCKVCFDQFAQKLKEKDAPAPAPALNKACEKCGKVRDIEQFRSGPDTPDFQSNWCLKCRQRYESLKKEKTGGKKHPHTPVKKAKNPPQRPAISKEKTDPPPDVQPAEKPAPKTPPTASDNFDYIEYLLENEALKEKLASEILQVPKQTTKIKARKRVCNGCGKTEEIDQVEKNTVIPVHAWFCDICRQRSARRWVRKGTTVCDYWGREFKVKKIISSDLVLGVLKDKNGKWETKPLKIYGNWNVR